MRRFCAIVLAACPLATSAQALAVRLERGVPMHDAPAQALHLLDAGSLRALLGIGPYFDISIGASTQALPLPSAASLKALLGFGRYLDASFGVGFVGLPSLSDSTSSMSGMASMVGVALRLSRPHDLRPFHGASPWVGAEAISVQCSAGDRRAVALAGGLSFPIGRERRIWVGPFVRYLQIMERNGTGLGNRASDGLSAGVAFESGSSAGPGR